MTTNLKLAWRNIWRNKRRTLITVASIFFGVLLSTLMTSLQEGTYSKMIENVVGFYSGYIQVHHPDFWEDKTIENTFTPSDTLINILENESGVTMYAPRLESFTLLSFKNNTKGVALIGIDPEKENQITKLSHWVEKGHYLTANDNGILVPINIAKNLGVDVGDTLVLMSQGFHGASAAALFPVKAILKFPAPTMNNLGVFIDIRAAQAFYSAPDKYTSMVLMVSDNSKVKHIRHSLQSKIKSHLKLMTWDEMDPLTNNMIKADREQNMITKAILFVLIGFGIFGTVIMMMAERRKELGVMVAIGMQKSKLGKIIFFETTLIGMVGVLIGFVVSLPLIAWLVYHPIPLTGETAKVYEQYGFEAAMYFSAHWTVFTQQVLIIFAMTMTVFIYPLVKIVRIKVSKDLHS